MTDKDNIAISVKGIKKSFRIPLDKGQSIKRKILGRAGKGYREFTPLNDVSFTVEKGDFFGIVGRNGSGKSTLLKTIAGIYEPTKGKVSVNGRLVPFIELGVGFNPQLTGSENVYLNGALLGFSRSEIDEMYDDIVDFAELHDFMEERLQNYSSGMQVRLAFSIAIRAKGDILLLDEVLAVGDTAFQQKCYDYFEQLKREGRTVILVTHSMANVEQFCNKGLLLEDGKISFIGSSYEVADRYRELFVLEDSATPESVRDDGVVLIDSCTVQPKDAPGSNKGVRFRKPFSIQFNAQLKNPEFSDFNFSFEIRNSKDILVVSESYTSLKFEYANFKGDKMSVRFDVDNILANGKYFVTIKVKAKNKKGIRGDVSVNRDIVTFSVAGGKYNQHSIAHPGVDASIGGADFVPHRSQ